jgi:multicomponent K+:H+ antiporter subunit A
MVGIVLSDNILLLVIFWELTSLSSFLLIGYWRTCPRRARGRGWRWPSPAAAGWR